MTSRDTAKKSLFSIQVNMTTLIKSSIYIFFIYSRELQMALQGITLAGTSERKKINVSRKEKRNVQLSVLKRIFLTIFN